MNNLAASLSNSTIVNKREIEPLLVKAYQMSFLYDRATGCKTVVLDRTHTVLGLSYSNAFPLCGQCGKRNNKGNGAFTECPSTLNHLEGLSKARQGGSHTYTCEAGFTCWTSPLYTRGRYAGSLISRHEMEKSSEEIRAMARLLQILTEKLSSEKRDYIGAKTSQYKPPRDKEGKNNAEKIQVYFHDEERMLLAALRRGDKDTASKILSMIMDIVQETDSQDFDSIRLRSIELAVFLSREASPDESNINSFRTLQESQNTEELRKNLQYIIDTLCTRIFSFRGVRHASALRKAERFIWENYTRKISLEEIAAASGLSAPYFSTIFKEEMGKNLFSYLNELRIEKASGMLTKTVVPINEIAESCGFRDQSWFSKIFKCHTGLTPCKFRELGNNKTLDGEVS